MDHCEAKRMRKGILTGLLVILIGTSVGAHQNGNARKKEQRVFSMEQEIVPVREPVKLSDEDLRALASDPAVSSCLENKIPPETRPAAAWFLASKIHLDGHDEMDLIVSTSPETPCFLGPYTSRFWVLRENEKGYTLVLAVDAHDLSVLRSKWKGHYEIEASVSNLHGTRTSVFKFDGKKYSPVEKWNVQ